MPRKPLVPLSSPKSCESPIARHRMQKEKTQGSQGQPETRSQNPSRSPKKRGMQVNNFGLQDPHRFTTVAFDSVGTSSTGS